MDNLDRKYFSNFTVDPEFESIFEYEDLYNLDIVGNPDQINDDAGLDDSDEFIWDDE